MPRRDRETAAEGVALVDAALDVSAPVEEQQQRVAAIALRRVDARPDAARRTPDGQLVDPLRRGRLAGDRGCPEIAEALPDVRDGHFPLPRLRVRELVLDQPME